MDDKNFMKKVLAILEKQQAALKKMAQSGPGDPFSGMRPEELTTAPLEEVQNKLFGPSKTTPATPQLDKTDPWAKAAPAPTPDDIKVKLDANPSLAKLKGNLSITGDITRLSVAYYTGAWRGTAQQLKDLLKSTLTGYNVADVVGHMKLDFTPTY